MSKVARIEIINQQQVIDAYTRLPGSVNSEIKKALRTAAKPAVAEIKSTLSQKSKRAVKARVSGREGINLIIGLFAAKRGAQQSGMDPYFKEYWREYGTLSKRSLSHRFTKPRKSATAAWRGGITARETLDPLIASKMPAVVERAREILKNKNIDV